MDNTWSSSAVAALITAVMLVGAGGCTDIFYPYNLVGSWDGECTADWEWEDWDTDVIYDVDIEIELDLSIRTDDGGRLSGDGDARFQMYSNGFGEWINDVDVDLGGHRSKGWTEITVEGDDRDWEEVVVKLEGDIYQDIVAGDCTVLNLVDEKLDGDFKLRR